RLTLSQAGAAVAEAQFATVQRLAHAPDGELIHPLLLERYRNRARAIKGYAARAEHYAPIARAHFDIVLAAVGAGRRELIPFGRSGDINDETLVELERELDLEELAASAAKS